MAEVCQQEEVTASTMVFSGHWVLIRTGGNSVQTVLSEYWLLIIISLVDRALEVPHSVHHH